MKEVPTDIIRPAKLAIAIREQFLNYLPLSPGDNQISVAPYPLNFAIIARPFVVNQKAYDTNHFKH
jgi:hypothetical protein